jgi:hypothetical protein
MNFSRIATGVDVAPLLAVLDANPQLWREITVRQEFPGSAHHDTETVYLRGPLALTVDEYMGTTTAIDYPAMAKFSSVLQLLLVPILRSLAVDELGYVMLVKLQPDGTVDQHIDEGIYADHYSRFHLVLTGEAGSTLTVGGETQHCAPGEVWWFDHKALHCAVNEAPTPRIHLIFVAVIALRT